MLEHIPSYLFITFLICVAFTFYTIMKASKSKQTAFVILTIWLIVQGILGYTSFYMAVSNEPQRFTLLIMPALVFIAILFLSARGKSYIKGLDLKILTILHVVRIPVEICLYWIFIQGYIPELMTFEGRNFDILAGLSAPIIYFLYFIRKKISPKVMIAWNIVSLALLLNIVINALLSAPLPFQQFAFDQPNIGILYFPFVWLPSFIVPIVMFSHLAAIRKLLRQT